MHQSCRLQVAAGQMNAELLCLPLRIVKKHAVCVCPRRGSDASVHAPGKSECGNVNPNERRFPRRHDELASASGLTMAEYGGAAILGCPRAGLLRSGPAWGPCRWIRGARAAGWRALAGSDVLRRQCLDGNIGLSERPGPRADAAEYHSVSTNPAQSSVGAPRLNLSSQLP